MEGALRRSAPDGLRLIETLRWEPGRGALRLGLHLARLAHGAAALGVALDPAAATRLLAGIAGDAPLRVRLTLGLAGDLALETAPAPAPANAWRVGLAAERLRSDDPWLAVKTTRREAYDAARAGLAPGLDEAILTNERGEVCDGTITTVFADLGDGLVTPPLASGVLPGVLRAEMLATGAAREGVLTPDDLRAARRVLVGNALRGPMRAEIAF